MGKINSLIKRLKKLGFSVKPSGHKDPVCGMTASSDLFKTEYQGKNYFFCSDHCKGQFLARPADYVD